MSTSRTTKGVMKEKSQAISFAERRDTITNGKSFRTIDSVTTSRVMEAIRTNVKDLETQIRNERSRLKRITHMI